MSKVLVIGLTHKTEVISIAENLISGEDFLCRYNSYLTGGQYTVAYNLAFLGVNTFFITRFGFDIDANAMMVKLDNLQGMIHSQQLNFKETPIKTYLFDRNKVTTLSNIPYNSYPDIEDGLPQEFFIKTDLVIVNILNYHYLNTIVSLYPDLRYICDNYIPSDLLLDKMEGLILEADYLRKTIKEKDFNDFASQLIDKGLKWILITDKGKKVSIFTKDGFDCIEKEQCGIKYLGTHEVFVSMFAASLVDGKTFSESVISALNISNDLSYVDDLELSKNLYKER
ncbi:MAG: hypothetical protein ACOX1F_01720 [Erysipelotrichaceae bacterium]|jgi:hypothetical protein